MNLVSKTLAAASFAAAGLLGSAAFAQSGSGGTFSIYNDTAGNVVVGFYTNDGSGWSNNWLGEHMIRVSLQVQSFSQKLVLAINSSRSAGWVAMALR